MSDRVIKFDKYIYDDENICEIQIWPNTVLFNFDVKMKLVELCKDKYGDSYEEHVKNPEPEEKQTATKRAQLMWLAELDDEIHAALGSTQVVSPKYYEGQEYIPNNSPFFAVKFLCYPKATLKDYKSLKFTSFADQQDSLNLFLAALSKLGEVSLTKELISHKADEILSLVAGQLQQQGVDLQEVLKQQNITYKDFRSQYLPVAEEELKTDCILYTIGEELGLAVTDNDRDQFFEYIAQGNNISKDEVIKALGTKYAYDNQLFKEAVLQQLIKA